MNLPNQKELASLLRLCRKQGVSEITMGDVSIKFGDMPMEIKGGERVPIEDDLPAMPNDEEMAFWSSQPDPLAVIEEKQ